MNVRSIRILICIIMLFGIFLSSSLAQDKIFSISFNKEFVHYQLNDFKNLLNDPSTTNFNWRFRSFNIDKSAESVGINV